MKIDADGTMSIQGDPRMLYSTMLKVRNILVISSKVLLSVALVIGIRYSIVRRQFKNISGQKVETQLIDY